MTPWLEELNEHASVDESQRNEQIGRSIEAFRPVPDPRGKMETLRALRRRRGSALSWLATAAACSLLGIVLLPAFMNAKVSAKRQVSADAPLEMAKSVSLAPATTANPMERASFSAKAAVPMGAAPSVGMDSADLAPNLPPRLSAQVIRNASLALEVADVAATQRSVLLDIRNEGGYAENSRFSDRSGGPARASIHLRIPNDKFDLILDKLQTMGRVVALDNSGKDVGVEIAGSEASRSALRVEEEQLRQMMAKARTPSERLSLRYRIDEVRRQITVEAAELRYLRDQVAFSTIQLELQGQWGFFQGWFSSLNPGMIVMGILILSPVWLLLFWMVKRR